MKVQPNITYNLLRIVNSVAYGLPRKDRIGSPGNIAAWPRPAAPLAVTDNLRG
jgi:hypothetical protein